MGRINQVLKNEIKTSQSNNYSLEFDGIDDYINISSLNDKIGNKNYIFSFWFKVNDLSTPDNMFGIFDIEDTSNSKEFT